MNFANETDKMDLERIELYMRDQVTKGFAKMEKSFAEMEKVNIVITGSSGVGKSTLINAVFGKNLAATAVGAPQTMEIVKITDPSLPMCLYDTPGLEIKDSEKTINEIRNKIEELRTRPSESEQIHAVWLCILERSNRVEVVHLDLLELFRSYKIPCIVVLTQAQGNEEFLADVQQRCAPVAAVVPVMATPMTTKIGTYPAENLDVLVNETLRILPESRQAAFEFCQKVVWDRKFAAACSAVNWACVAGASAAPIPFPGGHSAALIAIETAMLLRINHALGVSIEETEGKSVVLGILGIVVSTVAGRAIFGELITIIPGVGTVIGAVVKGTVAVTVTKILGMVYIDVVGDLAKKSEGLPKADILIGLLKAALEARKTHYIGVAKE